MPSIWSLKPSAHAISVAEGRNETMRRAITIVLSSGRRASQIAKPNGIDTAAQKQDSGTAPGLEAGNSWRPRLSRNDAARRCATGNLQHQLGAGRLLELLALLDRDYE